MHSMASLLTALAALDAPVADSDGAHGSTVVNAAYHTAKTDRRPATMCTRLILGT